LTGSCRAGVCEDIGYRSAKRSRITVSSQSG
jgi:hypothetical protein